MTTRDTVLRAQALSVTLPGDEGPVRVLDAVDFELHAGEIVDVGGPSGSGKTTLLRGLARLLPGATGELWLDGDAGHAIAPQRWRALVALLPQRPAIIAGSVADNLALPWTLKSRNGQERPTDAVMRAALDEVAMGDVALDRDASRLSVGQHARLALVRVMLTQPRVLLLDEADAALDPDSARRVAEAVSRFAQAGGGVVRVRHRDADGRASRQFVLAGGELTEVGE